MWINLSPDELTIVRQNLNAASIGSGFSSPEQAQSVLKTLEEWEADARSDLYRRYRDAAFEQSNRDGEIEIDLQSDDTACVSPSEDNGAYVMAWVWIDDSDAGIKSKEEAQTDEEKRKELRSDWQYEVANGDTARGLAEWITARAESELGLEPASSAPHTCKFCGAPSAVDPSDQTAPADYCHPADHEETL